MAGKKDCLEDDKRALLGLTVKKEEDFSEWYTQLVQKADFADYTSVSGSMVLKPNAYQIWEKIQRAFDSKIKSTGHKNVYFPLFIPEHLFEKEKEHVQGFEPEVAWVTHAGSTKLRERLAIRPTSETIMYESYAKWIRSHRDLPLLLNQWVNIVRWEFKHPRPFLRTREFLWQEGHTVHATREEALKEALYILDEYVDLMENWLAVPVLKGKKTPMEKFPGAEETFTMEALMPNGKALQMGTSHFLGQNFSKPFGIKFLDEDGKEKYAWQTSWGISTRLIGAIIMAHGDDRGAIIPPRLAENKLVIVPIVFEESKKEVLKKARELKQALAAFNPILDDRDVYSAGWKFNEWELKGIPLRVEVGPKDLAKKQVVLVRRDSHAKETVKEKDLENAVKQTLEKIQRSLLTKQKRFLQENTVEAKNRSEFLQALEENKLVLAGFCERRECEEAIKDETGASNRLIPFHAQKAEKCAYCGKPAKRKSYFSKAY